ncbi:MAG: pyridoxal-phosphate dependent enzyme [Acidimicrobiales bacterium]
MSQLAPVLDAGGANPFLTHRHQLDVYRHARAAGLTDAAYAALVAGADERVAAVAGTGFRATPLVDLTGGPSVPAALAGLAPVVAKVETANVSGSHKARHLFGLLLRLLIDDAVGSADGPGTGGPLAIASCGNAALGAAIVAASAGRALRVFVPTDANPAVLGRLDSLGAEVVTCPRRPGEAGDPCVLRLHEALAAGARPFTVQGPLEPAVIDGARTIGLELADQLASAGLTPADLFVQIGGGALATAVMDGLVRAGAGGAPPPRLHPVQATAAHPYVAGWRRIAPALLARAGLPDPAPAADPGASRAGLARAESAADRAQAEVLRRALADGRLHLPADLDAVAHLMTPWPGTPRSIAGGILDDLTYDWRTVLSHQIRSGGWPQLADEATLAEAAALAARLVAPPPDATGAAGLAGLVAAARSGTLPPRAGGEALVVLLTGVDRAWTPSAA